METHHSGKLFLYNTKEQMANCCKFRARFCAFVQKILCVFLAAVFRKPGNISAYLAQEVSSQKHRQKMFPFCKLLICLCRNFTASGIVLFGACLLCLT